MAEAGGAIIIKAPGHILDALESDGTVPWQELVKLAEYAEIKSLKGSNVMLDFYDGKAFYHEGVERKGDFLEITIFGEEWMYFCNSLTKKGKNIELYGSIFHEYGATEFYALNSDGGRYCRIVDYEGYQEVNEDVVINGWKKNIPDSIKPMLEL
ncbi:hypothetical protein [Aliikangiella coralliicola]|uniref:Uncharacterized protein n=1 Tax=Aliikangiella coralliicola TaxID=2592383 RepID=A0A545UEZ9_9GAMM|nr:hypothetical protein [Aliikangiella coralliicola]TQV88049.1 hypothetical protein FLL46_09580 [Aliikangiella coralliicola]